MPVAPFRGLALADRSPGELAILGPDGEKVHLPLRATLDLTEIFGELKRRSPKVE